MPRLLLGYYLLAVLLLQSQAAPVEPALEIDPELSGDYFQGDMEIDFQRNGYITETRHWPKGVVHFNISDVFDDAHKNHIIAGMKHIESCSCIRFYPADKNTVDVLHVIGEPTGCHTKVGYRGGVQTMNLQIYDLDSGCFKMGTIQHELLHSLGFHHQQSSPERDDFVRVLEENIKEGKENNFKKYSHDEVSLFDTEYDYGSILHYSSVAFSKNGKKTIVPLLGEDIEIGQRRVMSTADVAKLNIMYKCPLQF